MTSDIRPKRRQNALEKCVNSWIAISIFGNGTQVGYLREINGREITLNPHRGWRYNQEENCNLYELLNENAYLEVSPNGYFIEPTNLKTINYSIMESNEKTIEDKNKQKEIKNNSKS